MESILKISTFFFHCTQCAAQNYGNGGILKPCESDSAVLWFFHGKISWILIPLAYFLSNLKCYKYIRSNLILSVADVINKSKI